MSTIGLVRPIAETDAEIYRTFIRKLDCESKFMLFEPGERDDSEGFYQRLIDNSLKDPNVAWFVVEFEDQIIGYMSAVRGPQNRVRHRVHIAMGVLSEYQRRGAAKGLFEQLFRWANQQKVERIELSVVVQNTAAIALYTKMGFQIEGLKRRSLKVDGRWVDEYAMAKLISK